MLARTRSWTTSASSTKRGRKRIQDAAHQSAAHDFARREAQLRAQIESAEREVLELDLGKILRVVFLMEGIGEVPEGVNAADESISASQVRV